MMASAPEPPAGSGGFPPPRLRRPSGAPPPRRRRAGRPRANGWPGPRPIGPDQQGARQRYGAGRNLPVAIAVGLTLAAAFLVTIAVGAYTFLTFVAVLTVVAQLELGSAFRAHHIAPATLIAIGAGLVMLYGAYASGEAAQAVGLVVLVLGAMVWTLLDNRRRNVAAALSSTCLIGLWVPFLASYAALLLQRPDGELLTTAVVALTVANDIGAYAFGRPWGRHKLAPSISPGKSWEGLAGGLATVLMLAGIVTSRLITGLGMAGALALGAGIVAAATIGDLSESLVKRDLGVKDLGRILPGHGGVMDRIDGLLFALPTAHFILVAFGL
ncbi:MAG: phosphatidate cytidylyltransferase [Egibacteraceae bacterium]